MNGACRAAIGPAAGIGPDEFPGLRFGCARQDIGTAVNLTHLRRGDEIGDRAGPTVKDPQRIDQIAELQLIARAQTIKDRLALRRAGGRRIDRPSKRRCRHKKCGRQREPADRKFPHPSRARAAVSRSASAAFSAWSARAFSTASGFAFSTKAGLLRRPFQGLGFLGRCFNRLGDASAFGIKINDTGERDDEGRFINDQLDRAAFRGGVRRHAVDARDPVDRCLLPVQPRGSFGRRITDVRVEAGARRDAEFVLGRADFADQTDQPVDFRRGRCVNRRFRLRPFGVDQIIRPVTQGVP